MWFDVRKISMGKGYMTKPSFLQCENGARLAYHHTTPAVGVTTQVLFLCGFRSDMEGTKAIALEAHCKAQGYGFTRFDYRGHGQSSGEFEQSNIGTWLHDALNIMDKVVKAPVILAGSSMGGWIMLRAAMERKKQVQGLLGIASAPDFTESLMWDQLTEKQQRIVAEEGRLEVPTPYTETPTVITRQLLEESAEHFVLDKPNIPVEVPVRLLHGMKDTDVPFEFSLAINEKILSKDVRVNLLPEGDHRLSTPSDIKILCKTLDKLVGIVNSCASAA